MHFYDFFGTKNEWDHHQLAFDPQPTTQGEFNHLVVGCPTHNISISQHNQLLCPMCNNLQDHFLGCFHQLGEELHTRVLFHPLVTLCMGL
jgi:hypothetical protein